MVSGDFFVGACDIAQNWIQFFPVLNLSIDYYNNKDPIGLLIMHLDYCTGDKYRNIFSLVPFLCGILMMSTNRIILILINAVEAVSVLGKDEFCW